MSLEMTSYDRSNMTSYSIVTHCGFILHHSFEYLISKNTAIVKSGQRLLKVTETGTIR